MPRSRASAAPAFTLVELTLVVVIMGCIAGIAVPRLGSAADHAKSAVVRGSADELQKALDFYAAEHFDQGPEIDPDRTLTSTPSSIAQRLLRRTTEKGAVGSGGRYGPYLRAWPVNLINGKRSLRIDGPPAGANTAGWRLDSAMRIIDADNGAGAVGGAHIVAANDGDGYIATDP